MKGAEPTSSTSLPVFNWPELLIFFGLALVACAIGTLFSYNGPLSSPGWHDWAISVCSSSAKTADGAAHAPVIDIIRAALAGVLSVFAFYRLSIIPGGGNADDQRRLNWFPVLLPRAARGLRGAPSTAFEASFGFEKWVLAGFLALAVIVIALARPFDFQGTLIDPKNPVVGTYGHASYAFLQRIGFLYGADFSNITRTYLFPYSLYILGLWYCMALPVLLVLIRSVRYDQVEYSRLRSALEVGPIESLAVVPHNIAGLYERKSLVCFEFINSIGKRYAIFFLGVFVLCYIQQERLSCSVLEGAVDTGKLLLLILTMSSMGAVLYAYLRLHYDARRLSQAGINQISDALEKDPSREAELRRATDVAEVIRKRDGLAELYTVIKGAGLIGIVLAIIWNFILHKSMCIVAYAVLPDGFVNQIAKLLQLRCIPPH